MKKLKKEILELINGAPLLSDLFYDISKNTNLSTHDTSYPKEWVKIHFKTYPRLKRILLRNIPSKKIKSLLTRRSTRSFERKEVPFKLLSQLLLTTAGINQQVEDINYSRRSYPSAGARYSLEVYIVSLRIEGLKTGLYHYNVKDNSLEELLVQNMEDWIIKTSGGEKWMCDANFLVIITGVPDRSRIKYGERGYGYMLIEVGHLAQNICLLSDSFGLGTCPVGGFIETDVQSLLDIDNVKEYPLYMLAIGKKKNERT